jgi:hypothetical protein
MRLQSGARGSALPFGLGYRLRRRAAEGKAMSDKRELIKQYKRTAPKMGVYVIRNLVDSRVYLGASLNLDGAMNRDRFELGLSSHRNRGLLDDWRRLGAQRFRFEVLDTVKARDDPGFDYRDELAALFQLWSEELDQRGEPRY